MLKCIEKMRIQKVDRLLAVDDDGIFLGIVHPKHILRAEDKTAPVSTIMKKPAVTAAPDTSIVDLLKMVRQYDVSSIPILNERQELVGLITKSSLVTALSSQFLDLDAIDNTQEVTA